MFLALDFAYLIGIISFNPNNNHMKWYYYYFFIIDVEAEAWRGEAAYSRSQPASGQVTIGTEAV